MSGWHVSPAMAAAYVSGGLDDVRAWSVESHLESCALCAGAVSAQVSDPGLGRVRALVLAGAHRPARGFARLTVTPALSGVWVLAVAGVIAAVLLLDVLDATRAPLLLLVAPLLPLLGLAVGSTSAMDRGAELLASAPTSVLRVLLLRSATVLAASVPPLLVASVVTGVGPLRWLAPSAGLVGLSLALSTRVPVEVATGCAAAMWAVLALGPALLSTDPPAALTTPAVPAWLGCAGVGVALLVAGRERLEQVVPWR